jgi:nifR3 family TIM-barrel protein
MRQVTFNPDRERPIVAQIFGKEPENFSKAAAVLTALGVDAIDINMGCPARKVISSDCGSSLLKDPTLAEEIVLATVSATALDVSVKMRIGTSCYDQDYFFDLAKRFEKAGAKLLTVHGRTSKQMYGGSADFAPMYELKKILKIPVIGNGDVRSGETALSKIGNLDGVMVGRGSFGNPWVFAEILAAFEGRNFTSPTFAEKIPLMLRHLDLSCQFKGPKWGTLEMRKFFSWYLRGFPGASAVRQKLMLAQTREEVTTYIQSLLKQLEVYPESQPEQSVKAIHTA